MPDAKEVLRQSNAAIEQWGKTWEKHAKQNGELLRKLGTSHQDLLHVGFGKTLVCVSFGPSLEDTMEELVANQDKYDVACVDKAFGMLVDHGIIPKYVFLADAGIDYERWLKPWIDKTENVNFICNICGNVEWSHNWKGPVYFYVNKDNIDSEQIYGKISGCHEMIPAGSNVSNSVIIFALQILDYDQLLLVGYDFCWGDDDNYYAYSDGENKRYYMRHHFLIDNQGRIVQTSQNLLFSAKWLSENYLSMFFRKAKIHNCSKGILWWRNREFSKCIQRTSYRQKTPDVIDKIYKAHTKKAILTAKDGEQAVAKALADLDVVSVEINYIPKGFAA